MPAPQAERIRRRGSLILIVIYGVAIAIVARIIYQIVLVQREGPVIWKGYGTHGLHEGDLPAILLGIPLIPLILLMLLGILHEMRVRRRWRKVPE